MKGGAEEKQGEMRGQRQGQICFVHSVGLDDGLPLGHVELRVQTSSREKDNRSPCTFL